MAAMFGRSSLDITLVSAHFKLEERSIISSLISFCLQDVSVGAVHDASDSG